MAALVAVTIPFALLFALLLMYLTDIPIGLLSVGAIDFGIIVDGAVIMAENIARRLGGSGRERTRQSVHKTILGGGPGSRAAGVLLRADDHRWRTCRCCRWRASRGCCSARWR